MAECEQVDADMNGEVRLKGCDGCRLYEPVHAEAGVETNVVGNEDMVETCLSSTGEKFTSAGEWARKHLIVGKSANTQLRIRGGGRREWGAHFRVGPSRFRDRGEVDP